MKTVVAFPGTGIFTQQVCKAFLERDALLAFVTTFVFRERSVFDRLATLLPAGASEHFRRELRRRSVTEIPHDRIATMPMWEVLRMAARKGGASPVMVDRIWDHLSHAFDGTVARRFVPGCEAIYTYEYSALATLTRARGFGVAAILDLPAVDNRKIEALRREERRRFAQIANADDSYFARKFARRQERRTAEIEAADIIVTNSNLTMRSHIDAGACPEKCIAVPLAAPLPVASPIIERRPPCSPLDVVWAGTFSIRKGAHYFLDAWRALKAGRNARAAVFGAVGLPEQALLPLPEALIFKGSVPQSALFAAFDAADVLVFPTLSDGFGMVVTEALSRGLPVITTDQAGAADLIVHGKNGLIIPARDPEAIKNALQWCLDNRDKLHEMRFAALETANRWQWPDYRRALIEALDAKLRQRGFTPKFAPLELYPV